MTPLSGAWPSDGATLKRGRWLLADRADHVEAARLATVCKTAGVATTPTDCLIAAQAVTRDGVVCSTDQDFRYMQRLVPELRLLVPTNEAGA